MRIFLSGSDPQTAREKPFKKVETLLTDQYSALNSKDLKQYLKKRDIKLILTSVNNPSSNGLNERLNQTLVNRIRCKINESSKRAWPKIAEKCVAEYNATIHSVMKFGPNYLADGNKSYIVPPELVNARNLEKDRAEALLNSIKDFERNKARIDKNRKNCEIRVGDYVCVENGSKLNRNKLDEVRIGPFRVLKRISDTMFKIDCGKRKDEVSIFHTSKLVPTISDQ